MHRMTLATLATTVAVGLSLSATAPTGVAGQDDNPFARFGTEKYYSGGSAMVKTTGSIQLDREFAMNTIASYTDEEGQTWLTYGDEDAGEPIFLFTYGPYGYGVSIRVDRNQALGEFDLCEGDVEVTDTDVTGEYTCPGLDSYDNDKGFGKTDVSVRFTARFK